MKFSLVLFKDIRFGFLVEFSQELLQRQNLHRTEVKMNSMHPLFFDHHGPYTILSDLGSSGCSAMMPSFLQCMQTWNQHLYSYRKTLSSSKCLKMDTKWKYVIFTVYLHVASMLFSCIKSWTLIDLATLKMCRSCSSKSSICSWICVFIFCKVGQM